MCIPKPNTSRNPFIEIGLQLKDSVRPQHAVDHT